MMKVYPLICFFLINVSLASLFTSCSSLQPNDNRSKKEFNTTITIHFKKETDKDYTPFQQYDRFALENYGIIDPPTNTTENGKLIKIIKLNLDSPTLLLFGFNEFCIQPNENVDLNFEILKSSKTEYKDSISINNGYTFITRRNGKITFFKNSFFNLLQKKINSTQLGKIINEATLIKMADNSISEIFANDPEFKKNPAIIKFLNEYYIQSYFEQLMNQLNEVMPKMKTDVQLNTVSHIKMLTELLSQNLKSKNRSYWIGMKLFYNIFLNTKFQEKLYSYSHVITSINKYDSVTQQFLILLAIKRNSIPSKNKISYDTVQNNLRHLLTYISCNEFKEYLEKFKSESANSNFINKAIENCILYNYGMEPVYFKDIFTTAKQPYILFDFCGSWCKPCLDEIKTYTNSKRLDTSNIVKPIWIFFENDKTKWLKIVDKYELKKDNCFLVENKDIITLNFGKLFQWRGEFPHHFLFDKEGKIFDNNAAAFDNFKPQLLLKYNDTLKFIPLPSNKNKLK